MQKPKGSLALTFRNHSQLCEPNSGISFAKPRTYSVRYITLGSFALSLENPQQMNRIAFLTLFSMAFSSTMAQSDVVIDWNSTLSDVLLSNTTLQNPGMASRSMAMMNLAIYDAGNGVSPSHEQFYVHAAAPANASYDAAASQAAYTVLSSIYTDAPTRLILDSQLATSLAAIPDGIAKTNGIGYGSLVGTNVLNARTSDGFSNTVNYTPQSAVGHWEPDPLNPTQEAWGPQWGNLKTFGIADTNTFMAPPMPSLTSVEYADAFNEVMSLGAKTSTTRTADQTEVALFWAFDRLGIGTPMRMYNKIMRDISVQEGNTTEENARMFAMASTAIADAGITAWDAKFRYDFWRPITGIRRADEDGNPLTIADPDWEPLGAPGGIAPDGTLIPDFTPPFPTYMSYYCLLYTSPSPRD